MELPDGRELRIRRQPEYFRLHSGRNALLPHGVEPARHAWLRFRYWPTWLARRKAEAVVVPRLWADCRRLDFQTISEKRSRMMGGFGSGRRSGSGRTTVEACRSLDINRLHREGCLRAGWMGGWQWTCDGEKIASIRLRAEHDRLHLTYRVRLGGGEWEDVAEICIHYPRRLPLRWRAALFYLPRRGERNRLWTARRQAAWAGALLPVPALLSPRPRQPRRGRMGPNAAPCQQDQATPQRRSRHGRAIPAQAERYVAADVRAPARVRLRGGDARR